MELKTIFLCILVDCMIVVVKVEVDVLRVAMTSNKSIPFPTTPNILRKEKFLCLFFTGIKTKCRSVSQDCKTFL